MATPITVGGTFRFRLSPSKDGLAWDITSATVTLYLLGPGGILLTKSAPVSGAYAIYTTSTSDLSIGGLWYAVWRVVDGIIDIESDPIEFVVEARRHL